MVGSDASDRGGGAVRGHRPAAHRHPRANDPFAEIDGGRERRIDRGGNLRLQPHLLVQPDLHVGEQHPGGARRAIGFAALPLIVGERVAQVVLPVRRRTAAQVRREGEKLRRALGGIGRDRREKARELAADLGEHLEVAGGDGGAGPLEGVEGRVNRRADTAQCRLRLEQAFAQQHPRERGERRQQPRPAAEDLVDALEQIFTADGAAGLPRRPRREAAPVGRAAAAGAHRRRELGVALGDFQIPNYRIDHGGNPVDILDLRTRRQGNQGHRTSCALGGGTSYSLRRAEYRME
jgi:hypothetical protein